MNYCLLFNHREDIWVFYRGGKCFKAKIAPNGKIHEFTDAYTTPLEDQSSTEKFSLKEVFVIYFVPLLHV